MILHALTAILVVLKALEMISISWWWCVMPSILAFGFLLSALTFALLIALWAKTSKF